MSMSGDLAEPAKIISACEDVYDMPNPSFVKGDFAFLLEG